jgi:putative ABC transport system substrate-binding protein
LGYEEGKNLHLDWRNLPDEAAARATAQAFVREPVDLMLAFENQTIQAAQAATAVIPIVMVHAYDPVANGFVRSMAHPGGNVTGQAAFAWEGWYAKKLELFKELVPHLRRVLVLVDPQDPLTPRLLPEVQHAAAALQLHAKVREATTQAEIEQWFSALTPGEVGGVFVASNNLETDFPSLTMRLALAHRLPMPVPLKQWVVEGGLFYYGIDHRATGRAAARQVDRILKGKKPADLPVEQPKTFEFVINLKTAQTLGLTLPPHLLYFADEVIQ